MKKIKIFVRANCSHCERLYRPENLNIEYIDVSAPDYEGHLPASVPAIQISMPPHNSPLQGQGADFINDLITLIMESQDGIYKK